MSNSLLYSKSYIEFAQNCLKVLLIIFFFFARNGCSKLVVDQRAHGCIIKFRDSIVVKLPESTFVPKNYWEYNPLRLLRENSYLHFWNVIQYNMVNRLKQTVPINNRVNRSDCWQSLNSCNMNLQIC